MTEEPLPILEVRFKRTPEEARLLLEHLRAERQRRIIPLQTKVLMQGAEKALEWTLTCPDDKAERKAWVNDMIKRTRGRG